MAGQLHRRAVERHPAAPGIEGHRAACAAAACTWPLARRIRARSRASTSSIRKRLGDVVVGAAVDAAGPSRASCRAPSAPAPARAIPASRHCRSSVSPSIRGRPRSRIDRVVALGAPRAGRPAPVGSRIHGVARAAQRAGQLRRQADFVFDEQHAHGTLAVIAHREVQAARFVRDGNPEPHLNGVVHGPFRRRGTLGHRRPSTAITAVEGEEGTWHVDRAARR